MSIEMNNLFKVLDGQALDPAVGIKVARLSGEGAFCIFGAEITPGTRLSAHYHQDGPEIYYILAGKGRMTLGTLAHGTSIDWEEAFEVCAGDCFTVRPGWVHQLENPGPEPLNALFGCAATHLSTDRVLVGVRP